MGRIIDRGVKTEKPDIKPVAGFGRRRRRPLHVGLAADEKALKKALKRDKNEAVIPEVLAMLKSSDVEALQNELEDQGIAAESEIQAVLSKLPHTDLSQWAIQMNKKGNARVDLKKVVYGTITFSEVMEAILLSDGLKSRIAAILRIPILAVNFIFEKHKELHALFAEHREAMLDELEGLAMEKIRTKADSTLMIFMLRCLGKDRGYVETFKESSKKKASIKMKIVPADKVKRTDKLLSTQKNVLSFAKKAANARSEE
jgi:hypothetical protein